MLYKYNITLQREREENFTVLANAGFHLSVLGLYLQANSRR